MWPDMSMRCYQRAQPKVKAICEKYGMPYVQESVFKRVRQLVDVMVGKKSDVSLGERRLIKRVTTAAMIAFSVITTICSLEIHM